MKKAMTLRVPRYKGTPNWKFAK